MIVLFQLRDIFLAFLKLGVVAFGGPIAHLGFFRDEFVERRGWLTEEEYGDLVALGQFLPGPGSSQVGMAIGYLRAGYWGALAAWIGFTLPAATIMMVCGVLITTVDWLRDPGLLGGLKLAATAVVARAIWEMSRSLCPDRARVSIAIVGAMLILLMPGVLTQIAVILGGMGMALWLHREAVGHVDLRRDAADRWHLTKGTWVHLGVFVLLLVGLPLWLWADPSAELALFDAFYRTGALVFGGGHVVLPLLEQQVVVPGWVDRETFLAGYGTMQALPGPLFSFAGFLGTAIDGPLMGLLCLVAIFLPSWLLVMGALPIWDRLRTTPWGRVMLPGANAAVVGLLLAAFYDPILTSALRSAQDMAVLLAAFLVLQFWRWPPWQVVLACAIVGWVVL